MIPLFSLAQPGRQYRWLATMAALCVALFTLAGCNALKDKTYTLDEARKKFIDFCKQTGTVDRSQLENVASIHDTILDPNNKNGVWESTSEKEIFLKSPDAITEENVKKIAKNDFDRVWPVLKKAKESHLDISIRQVGKTEWIYLALDEPLFFIKASHEEDKAQGTPTPLSMLSLDGKFDNRSFRFTYDVVPDVLPADPGSYGFSANEDFAKKRQLIEQGIQEVFLNLSPDKKTQEEAPIFFVIVVCDIKHGIASRSIFYLPDFQAYVTTALPFEEYYLRNLSDVFGDENLIGDKTGKNLAVKDITWPYFLTTQIKNRIKFKFTQSKFKPDGDPDNIIVTIVANTLRYYPFQDFDTVDLLNRRILYHREEREMNFDKKQLKTYEVKSDWEDNKGQATVIRFRTPAAAVRDNQLSDNPLPVADK